ncbi:MAG: 16S rRNA (uracil(1498)-N(3))-methyltransferase [Magnetococcales bacterium]|nr:16S rRNA (uracil(1498)-N(3))-methyltransferase [Magnetococcales bacterium]
MLHTVLELPSVTQQALMDWRVTPGAIITVRDDQGTFYRACWHHDGRHIHLFERLSAMMEPRWPRCLFQAIPDKQRMHWIIQKGVELGATMIQPMYTARSNPFPDGEAGQQHWRTWRKLALSAARQCRRAVVPEIRFPVLLSSLLTDWQQQPAAVSRLYADLPPYGSPLREWVRQPLQQAVDLLIGPEGGWSDQERQEMQSCGIAAVTLGSRVLRTETASVVALTILMVMDDAD